MSDAEPPPTIDARIEIRGVSVVVRSALVREVRKDRQSTRTGTRAVLYQLELIRCGKGRCCPHGPYWFAYWRHAGKRWKRYVGQEFKTLSLDQLRAFERGGDKRKAARTKKKAR